MTQLLTLKCRNGSSDVGAKISVPVLGAKGQISAVGTNISVVGAKISVIAAKSSVIGSKLSVIALYRGQNLL